MTVINMALVTRSWWSLAVLPGCIFLEYFLDYIFEDKEKVKDYGIVILLVINILLIPSATKSLLAELSDDPETAMVTNVAVSNILKKM